MHLFIHFHTWHQFLRMGGYGFYVWLAYGLVAALLIWQLVSAALTFKSCQKSIKQNKA